MGTKLQQLFLRLPPEYEHLCSFCLFILIVEKKKLKKIIIENRVSLLPPLVGEKYYGEAGKSIIITKKGQKKNGATPAPHLFCEKSKKYNFILKKKYLPSEITSPLHISLYYPPIGFYLFTQG